MPVLVRYGLTLAMVAAATLVAFVCEYAIEPRNLALVYVVPVALAAALWGWRPALVSAVASVFVFEFFFIPPRFTIWVSSSSDLWALALLLVVAAIVSTLAAESRRRALEARDAAEKAEALQSLAHAVVHGRPAAELVRAAADALARMFKAPAVVFVQSGSAVTPAAVAGGAVVSQADRDAAAWALETHLPTRAETYPHTEASFDLIPVTTPSDGGFVLGVSFAGFADGRPAAADRLLELVGGYLAAAPPDRRGGKLLAAVASDDAG